MARCSVPRILGFGDWFDSRFDDLCHEHDRRYKTLNPLKKLQADFIFARGVAKKGYPEFGVVCFTILITAGTLYWVWKRANDSINKRKL